MIKIENCENNRTTVSIKMEDGMKDLPAASGHTATTYRDTVYALDEHIDDFEEDLEKENLASEFDEAKDASWGEVCQACCIHSPLGWVQIAIALFVLVGILYFFLFGLELLGTSAMVVGGCTAGSLFGSNTNPIAAVMIGMMSTALIQSSSTTTSIIVSLVSGGLDVKQAIYMIMGTNIGSSK